MPKQGKRIVVFIDNSNTFRRLKDLHKVDNRWPKLYNPAKLAEKLAGGRDLVGIYFYCTPPPPYLLKEGKIGSKKYWTQVAYYEAVKKLPKLELKYARLTGGKGNLKEKNLDTQLTADMIRLAAENSFDTAILVASDGDYQAAVETVRNFEKIIELLYFKGGISMALKRVCDIVRRARRSYFEPLNFPTVDNE